jgi:hypothetical protein
MIKKKNMLSCAVVACCLIFQLNLHAQHVFIAVIDGGRYTETFGSKGRNLPHIWNDLRPKGTIYTNFRNNGKTITCPGHAALLTGVWEDLPNNGTKRPESPTVFEYFREQTGLPEHSCYVVSGKNKLEILTHSTDSLLGSKYGASFLTTEVTSDTATWNLLLKAMDNDHPRIVIINFPEVDVSAHDSDWTGYLGALRRVDSLVWCLWEKIQSDSLYKDSTTLFVTNDHGRHDKEHGGFENHGDSCEGCRHIMLLALGPEFPKRKVIRREHSQIDIAPTIGRIMNITLPASDGKSLLPVR